METTTETLTATGNNADVRALECALKAATESGCVITSFNNNGDFNNATVVIVLQGTPAQVAIAQGVCSGWSNS